ncbi:mandelate racemase/muconate lactonizing enzyme [Ephemerocybe angulata]|uniref:Mandelate racemase/muconate lactonizing enzyme n=1 Tax=Ephemerocybe angulata TaxID=980116 RepID=A0A8H6IE13_9AGAR|nr:mandelate racemase/muconate lactonizing enzyme [Tulosesus angulatus]
MPKITGYETHDVRFPTSLTGDGTDAMNTDCDYSSAYVTLLTDSDLVGHGMTFTIGRGNDIVCTTIKAVADRLVGKDTEELFGNMGKAWDHLVADPQLRWVGPEKGVIHIATGAVNNALWDMFASLKVEAPLEAHRRLHPCIYPAYVTSAGWLGYSDEKISPHGFNHFKMKTTSAAGKLIRSLIDDPTLLPEGVSPRDPESDDLKGKNAGPTGSCLAEIKPWFIEEPTAPDDILGHATIRKALKSSNIGVATGEHAHNRMVFKQLLQADAVDVAQIDSCRLAGVTEVLSVLLMAAKFGTIVCPHAGGVGLCEYVIHLRYVQRSPVPPCNMERNVLEYVDHLHEHFYTPCSINARGRYNVPSNPSEGYSIEMKKESIAEFEWPNGTYWQGRRKSEA